MTCCENCRGPIPPGGSPTRRYCGQYCRNRAYYLRTTKFVPRTHCHWCKGPMPPGLSPQRIYCSEACKRQNDNGVRRRGPDPRPCHFCAAPTRSRLEPPCCSDCQFTHKNDRAPSAVPYIFTSRALAPDWRIAELAARAALGLPLFDGGERAAEAGPLVRAG